METKERARNVAPTFNKMRMTNWMAALFLAIGAATMLIGAKSLTGFLIITAVSVMLVAVPTLTAVALSRDGVLLLGIPLLISSEEAKALRKVMLATNAGLGLLSLIGVVFIVIRQEQYLVAISMLFYVILAAINAIMLGRAISLLAE